MPIDSNTLRKLRKRSDDLRKRTQLTQEQIDAILTRFANGESARSLARAHGVSHQAVRYHIAKALG